MVSSSDQLAGSVFGKDFVDYGKLFLRETSIFLRYDHDGASTNVPVTCKEASSKTNVVAMIWPDTNLPDAVAPPPVNAKVTCITMLRGRLLQLPARVSGLCREKQLTLMLAMDKAGRVVNLRRHPRYRVYGWVLMGEFTSSESLAQRHEMDISMGGFGANVIEWQWAIGDQYPFKLTAQIFASEELNKTTPSLKFSGSAVLRRYAPAGEPQLLQVGAEYIEISPDNATQLKAWLEENRIHLRET